MSMHTNSQLSKVTATQLQAFFVGFPDPCLLLDDAGTILAANRAAFAAFSAAPEEIVGKRLREIVPGQAGDSLSASLLQGLATGAPATAECALPLPDREHVYEARLVRLGDGNAVAVLRDITAWRRLKEELLARDDELGKRVEEQTAELARTLDALGEEASGRVHGMAELFRKDRVMLQQSRQAAMGEMISNIAHQWRQPLNAVGLIIQDLAMAYECGDLTREYLDNGIDNAMGIIFQMSQTIDDFRSFFKPDKEKSRFRVNRVIAKSVSLIEESFKEQQIWIETNLTGDPVVHGYPNEYSQVLLNILLNARDAFTERPRSGDARITVSSFTENGKAVVTIADTAGGIAEEIMDKVFDPYFTTKANDKGTGLGLFMAKSIIEKNMHGLLTARNTGGGAEIRIEV